MSLSVATYPFPRGPGVLLLGPIPALSQGEGRVLPGQVDRVLTDKQSGVQYLAQGRFSPAQSRDLNQRPALPAELQPPLQIFLTILFTCNNDCLCGSRDLSITGIRTVHILVFVLCFCFIILILIINIIIIVIYWYC